MVLTHGHIDHAGSAAEVRRRTGARTYAHAADLELINKGEAERSGTSVTPGIIPAIAYLLFIKPGGTKYESFAVDQTLKDGETLPMANDIELIHSSAGLCPDSCTALNMASVLFGHPASTNSTPSSVSNRYALTIPIFNCQKWDDICKAFDMEK